MFSVACHRSQHPSSPRTPPLSLVTGESAKRASPCSQAAGCPDSPPCPAPEGDPDIPGEAKSMPSNIPALKLQLRAGAGIVQGN